MNRNKQDILTLEASVKEKKYEFTGEEKKWRHRTLKRIRRLSDGKLGGWLEHEHNLSHFGECWVDEEAKVFHNALVFEDAQVSGNAELYYDCYVFGCANISGHSRVSGYSRVYENAKVFGHASLDGSAFVFGNSQVYDDANVQGAASIYGNAKVYEQSRVLGHCDVYGNAQVYGEAWVLGEELLGNAEVAGESIIVEDCRVSHPVLNVHVPGYFITITDERIVTNGHCLDIETWLEVIDKVDDVDKCPLEPLQLCKKLVLEELEKNGRRIK